MKATLLVENHSLFNSYLNAEHGFSAWIEDEGCKVLYDMACTDKFIHNAEALGIDLREADYVIISHGHRDHCGGLKYLIKYYEEHAMYRKPVLLMAGREIMCPKFEFNWNQKIGMDVSLEEMERHFEVRFSEEPLWLTPNLCFMGRTKIMNDFERSFPQTPMIYVDGQWRDDYVDEDTQLCYRHKNGTDISIIAGCAHYGICNIMEYAKELTSGSHIHTYLGGSHLRSTETPRNQFEKTCQYVGKEKIQRFYICHDTDLPCVVELYSYCPVLEGGTGLVVEFD